LNRRKHALHPTTHFATYSFSTHPKDHHETYTKHSKSSAMPSYRHLSVSEVTDAVLLNRAPGKVTLVTVNLHDLPGASGVQYHDLNTAAPLLRVV
jgi:hypothetical protein